MNSRFQNSLEGFLRRAFRPRGICQIENCVVATSLGRVRAENQDRVLHVAQLGEFAPRGATLTVVADGMGGMTNGGRAAEIASSSFVGSFLEGGGAVEQRLRNAALQADVDVFSELRGRGGATITAALVANGVAFVVSVGDSRAYTYERSFGLKQVTEDDTLGEMLKKSGSKGIEVDRANQLVQFIGLGEGVEPHSYVADAGEGSMLLILSDGAYSVGDDILRRLCAVNETPQKLAESILAAATSLGGFDNASAAVMLHSPSKDLLRDPSAVLCLTAAAGAELCILLHDAPRVRSRVGEERAENVEGAALVAERKPISDEDVLAKKPRARKKAKKVRKTAKPKSPSSEDTKSSPGALSLEFPEEG